MKTIDVVPYPGEMGEECVCEMPADAEVIGMEVSLMAKPLLTPVGANGNGQVGFAPELGFNARLHVVYDPTEMNVPRRFVLVGPGAAVPDHARFVVLNKGNLPNGKRLAFYLFEVPGPTILTPEMREEAVA